MAMANYTFFVISLLAAYLAVPMIRRTTASFVA